jgi:hypothetical protein
MSLGDELLDRETHKPPHCDPVEFGADLDQFPTAREIVGIGEPHGPAIVCLILLLHIRSSDDV